MKELECQNKRFGNFSFHAADFWVAPWWARTPCHVQKMNLNAGHRRGHNREIKGIWTAPPLLDVSGCHTQEPEALAAAPFSPSLPALPHPKHHPQLRGDRQVSPLLGCREESLAVFPGCMARVVGTLWGDLGSGTWKELSKGPIASHPCSLKKGWEPGRKGRGCETTDTGDGMLWQAGHVSKPCPGLTQSRKRGET